MKLILIYFFLVGAPILGVAGLLHMGERLAPPASVKGNWIAELEMPADLQLPASGSLVLTISQSGTQLFVAVQGQNQLILSGHIEEEKVSATAPQEGAENSIDKVDSRVIQLDARLDRQVDPESLRGVLTMSANPSPIQVPFVATRK